MKRKASASGRDEVAGSSVDGNSRGRIGDENELHNGEDVSTALEDMATLLSLLACSLCTRQVELPVTLLCKHTLCAHHVERDNQLRLAPCPLPACVPVFSPSPSPNIPSTSRVTCIPASLMPPDAAPATCTTIGLQTDVTTSKVAAIVRRHAAGETSTGTSTGPYSSGDSTDAKTATDER